MGRRFILISRKLPCTALSTSAIHPIVMPKRKQSPAVSSAPAVSVPANLQSSKRSLAFRFPVLVAVSLSLSSLLYSFASGFTAGDLSSVSRSPSDWWEIAGLLGWKTAELGVGWWGDYDGKPLRRFPYLNRRINFRFYRA